MIFVVLLTSLFLLGIEQIYASSSPLIPLTNYNYSISMQENISELWWNVNEVEEEILFELHVRTTGWIALGISPGGGMTGADILLTWIDSSGRLHLQDRYAYGNARPVMDSTTIDWIGLQGREMNGWTAIQFKRFFDTCDSMDVPIQTGTNHLIFAYGLTDPDNDDITYHEDRRSSRVLSLRAYTDVPPASKYLQFDSLEFRVTNYTIPISDTSYYCQVFQVPTAMIDKRHAIAYEILIDRTNADLVHHLLLYECGSTVNFNNQMLPKGPCQSIYRSISPCLMNAAVGWAIGGHHIVEYPEEAGYPFGSNFSVQYYLLQMHYNNPRQLSNRRDRSGLRFILGNTLRTYDVGYLTLGSNADELSLVLPPQIDQFHVDSYCHPRATQIIPQSGILVFEALPHTHLQGRSVWTKLIRNGTFLDYLYKAESYDFNHQIVHQLQTPIRLYPGDGFYTRCVYNTMNKNTITLGGESTSDEMCLHFFGYYPRIGDFYTCVNMISPQSWMSLINNASFSFTRSNFLQWLLQLQWTNRNRLIEWQRFYDNASRYAIYGGSTDPIYEMITLPPLTNVDLSPCLKRTNRAIRTDPSILSMIIIIIIIILSFESSWNIRP